MLHQMSGLSLKSPLRLFTALVFHLLLIHSCKGQNQLIGSSQPIVATVGDDIILPCHLKPAVDVTGDTLEWTRPDLNPTYVHIWYNGVDLVNTQHPSYKGRTSLITEELKHGNISLKLSKVKVSDEGTYKCHMPWIDNQSLVELVVGAASSLVISLAGIDTSSSRVVLQCESKGWYPEPEVFWLDGERKLLSAGPTETVRGPDDLYTVISRVTVEKRHSNNFTCRVQQNHINQTRETYIIVPDEFFMFLSNSGVSINIRWAVSLAVCILLIFAFVFFVWRQNIMKRTRSCMDKTKRAESNETKLQVAEAAETKSLMKTQRVSENNKETKCFNDQQQLQQEQQRREEAENKVENVKQELENVKQEKGDMKQELENMKQELENVKQELENMKQEKGDIKQELENMKQEKGDMKQELENMKQEKGDMKQELENMKIKTQHDELQRLRSELETKKKKFNDQQQLQQQRREEAENKVENMKQELENMKLEKGNMKQELENMKIKTQHAELQRLRSELETLKKELEDIQNPHKRFSWLFSTNEQLEKAKKEVETLEKKLKTKQDEFDMKFNELLELEKNMDQEVENMKQELKNIKQELENMKVKTQHAELQRLRSELETKKKELEDIKNSYKRFSR